MIPRVGFMTTLRTNVGDDFIREGICAVLEACGLAFKPFYVNKHDPASIWAPRPGEVELLADKFHDCDLFIQSGTPVYWHLLGGRSTSLNSDWYAWLWRDRILATAGTRRPLFINIGAGSCQPWEDRGESFVTDPACADFAQAAGERAEVTIVRDPVAAHMLARLSVPHHALPCPAFLAGARHPPPAQRCEMVGVNLMPLGAHYDLSEEFDPPAWQADCVRLCDLLRDIAPLLFICHDTAEREYAGRFALPSDRIFMAEDFRAYMQMYSRCSLVVANRVHGAVCAAGLGVPAIIVGNDTRAMMGDYIGLPRFRSGRVNPVEVAGEAAALWQRRQTERDRLLALRERTVGEYAALLGPIVQAASETAVIRAAGAQGQPAVALCSEVRLASVDELHSARYTDFVCKLNRFAAEYGLRQIEGGPEAWEYPWLWFHAMARMLESRPRVVDLGSGRSPLPWLLAAMGARVTLVTPSPQFLPQWRQARDKLGVDVQWRLSDSQRIPLDDASADLVSGIRVIDRQADRGRALNEAVRVLRPAGVLAVSFSICGPALGMALPQSGGNGWTMEEFEQIVWKHPAFGNAAVPVWNPEDIAAFRQWHMQSAAHRDDVVAAAVLAKR